MAYVDFLSSVHKSTKRDYVARVTEFPKAEAARRIRERQRRGEFAPALVVEGASALIAAIATIPLALWTRDYTVLAWTLLVHAGAYCVLSHVVASHRYALGLDRALDLAHATAAVDDQIGTVQAVREIVSLVVLEVQFAADVLSQPARNLDSADIVTDRVMRTGFADQDAGMRDNIFPVD